MNALKLFRSLVAPAAAALIFAPVVLGQGTATQPPKEPVKEPAKPEAPKTAPVTTPDKKAEEPKPTKQEDKIVQVRMTTSMGEIVLELNETKAPVSVKNFLSYVDKKYYDGTIFHRVIDGFMIQGGGFTPDMKQKKTDPKIKNEWQNGLKNNKYTIAMARVGGDADSATSQFFINVADNSNLDRPQGDGAAYAVFGKVLSGQDVVDKIKAVKTNGKMPAPGQMADVPVEAVTIVKVERMETTKAPEAPKPAEKK